MLKKISLIALLLIYLSSSAMLPESPFMANIIATLKNQIVLLERQHEEDAKTIEGLKKSLNETENQLHNYEEQKERQARYDRDVYHNQILIHNSQIKQAYQHGRNDQAHVK